ncbi:MAG: hypothetical protein WA851_22825 [Xanthobacteraceae bacterium]
MHFAAVAPFRFMTAVTAAVLAATVADMHTTAVTAAHMAVETTMASRWGMASAVTATSFFPAGVCCGGNCGSKGDNNEP